MCVYSGEGSDGLQQMAGPLAGLRTAVDATTCQGVCAACGGNFSGSGVRRVCEEQLRVLRRGGLICIKMQRQQTEKQQFVLHQPMSFCQE